MSARDIVGGLSRAAVSAARNPLGTAGFAFGVAKGVVARGTSIADSAAHRLRHHEAPEHVSGPARAEDDRPFEQPLSAVPDEPVEPPVRKTTEKTTEKAPETAPAKKATPKKAPAKKATARKAPAKKASAKTVPAEPEIVLREPGPPAEPPIDVVGEALAAEATGEGNGGRAGEPKASTRDEQHGEAGMQRAERDEIAEEAAEATPAGDLDLDTPVGTTGADAGRNPDTAEADLQQPGTAPLMDPATTAEVASEQETLRKASRKRKT